MIKSSQSERTQNMQPCAGCFKRDPDDETWADDMNWDAQQYEADREGEND